MRDVGALDWVLGAAQRATSASQRLTSAEMLRSETDLDQAARAIFPALLLIASTAACLSA